MPESKKESPSPQVCESKKCHKQEDCEADECCVQVLSIADPTCRKLRQRGDHCLTDLTMNDGNYAFGCPCVKGLKCGPQKVLDHNGVVKFEDRCGD
ncbi:hypothetical protein AVEN_109458-1 [Araneus ventricosus]|uniref:Prokineticin domain-containing protein n=1 Tax=Araneus ventricosus TaxID=182803 RepID=A0A4Y2MF34_ARAVE|nr:hypothetical protein AVEN_109458-1 [Araneus ventricosus]